MSIKNTVASALKHFPFDPASGFIGQKEGENPCYHCVLSVISDARVCCVAEEGSLIRCIICADANRICCAVPEELLGTAQKIWNSYNMHVCAYGWSGLQRWRIINCFNECISAFQKTYDILLYPERTLSADCEDINLGNDPREHARQKNKALDNLILAVAAGCCGPAEIHASMAAIFPGIVGEMAKIINLRTQLGLIDSCPVTAVPGEDSNYQTCHKRLKPELIALLSDASASGASAPCITYGTS